jgi:hypothetical protein
MTQLTILNSMAGSDFAAALDRHVEWGIRVLDLKDGIFGKGILDLTDEEARRASDLIRERGLSVHCFSTLLFHDEIELGEDEFRGRSLAKIPRAIELARILQPAMIRLLAAQTTRRAEMANTLRYISAEHPWLIPLYGEAIDLLNEAGFASTIENEVGRCIFSNCDEITGFFGQLGRCNKVCFTWDVQNLWQMGTFPTTQVYAEFKDLIGYYHVKGGQSDGETSQLKWRAALEDASWPVEEITRQVIADGVSPVICLNPSHGGAREGYDYADVTARDLDFLRAIPGVE